MLNQNTQQTIALPSHMFIPASADLNRPYLKVLAVGPSRLEACALIEGNDSQRTVGIDYFIKKTGTLSLLIFDLAGTDHMTTLLKLHGKNADIVLFFGDEVVKFQNELARLGLSEGKMIDIPNRGEISQNNYEKEIMTFLSAIVDNENALSVRAHLRHEDMIGKQSCQIL